MKLKKFIILLAIIACLPAIGLAAGSPTETMTATITLTGTITDTSTNTPTVTPTATITQTFTNSPTPQASVYAYPNPAYHRDTMFVAYPSKTGNASDFKLVIITIYGANGDYVARITDDFPNGYTEFPIAKLARGTYIYKVLVRYQDATEVTFKYQKFAIVK
jgi:hypothetical protein